MNSVGESRLRRQVVGRDHLFAAVCPPGFETECVDELKELGVVFETSADAATVARGGVVEFKGKLEDLYRVCLGSACVSRVRLRLDDFRAGAREELFRKAAAFPWELWLNTLPLIIDSHVEYSRISHEGMAAETLYDAISRHLSDGGFPVPERPELGTLPDSVQNEDSRENGASPGIDDAGNPTHWKAVQRLLLRIVENHVEISLDASGEHQHRRGWRYYTGLAPIRENLSAAILRFSGWPHKHKVLVDGMCGSGTFPIEAAILAEGRWPGVARTFAFESWPAHQSARWNWLRRQPRSAVSAVKIFANEIGADVIAGARQNAERANAGNAISWSNRDFFDLKATDYGSGLLVLNPPYGKRIGEVDDYERLCSHLPVSWRGWTAVVLAPEGTPPGLLKRRIVQSRVFRHGGLRIECWLCEL